MARKRLLTDEQVKFIRDTYAKRKALPTYQQLADKYGVSEPTILRISKPNWNPDRMICNLGYPEVAEIHRIASIRRSLPSVAQMAKSLGVNTNTIWDIITGATYRTDDEPSRTT